MPAGEQYGNTLQVYHMESEREFTIIEVLNPNEIPERRLIGYRVVEPFEHKGRIAKRLEGPEPLFRLNLSDTDNIIVRQIEDWH